MRWLATIYYRTENGTLDVTHDLEELSDIDQAVETGPHWDTIEKVVITRGEALIEGLTVKAAEQL